MATAITSTDDGKHLEIFCLIWLDTSGNETQDTEQKLRSTINYLKKFQDLAQCQQYIEQSSKNDRLILIVSDQLGRKLVPSIHKLRQVVSIYVYCMDKEANKQWSSAYSKVKGVVVQLDKLVTRITADHKVLKKVEEPLSYSTFTTSGGKSTSGVNGEFVFTQILIDCLLKLQPTETDKKELIQMCKDEYKGNRSELDHIREFEQDYSPDKALWWYTKDSFFYKILNGSLLNQNIHIMYLLRSFISDIYQQLQRYQSKRPLTVYRSQMMSNDELESLKTRIGQFISINSFFSTSIDDQKALSFLHASEDLERVLFKIHADPKVATTKPFADISRHSDYPGEAEVLFMPGSIFRLESVDRDKDDKNIWIIRMSFCSDDEQELKQVRMFMKKKIDDEKISLQTLGKLLWEMGKPDLAEKYFIRLLNQLQPNDPLRIHLYKDLGKLASQGGQFDMGIQWHQTALELEKQLQSSVKPAIAKTIEPTVTSPFYNACRDNNIILVEQYLRTMSLEEINQVESNGSTALHVAAYRGHDKIVELLLRKGASCSTRNKYNAIPLDEAQNDKIRQLIRRRMNNNRFISDSVEWVLTIDNADYQSHEYFLKLEPYGKDPKFHRLIKYIKVNYLDKDLQHIDDINTIEELFNLAIKNKDPVYLLKAYTAETGFYSILNVHLAQLKLENLTMEGNLSLAYYIGIIARHPKFENISYAGTTYRGMMITNNDLKSYKIGTKILTKTFSSTSKQMDIASSFLKDTSDKNDKLSTVCAYQIRNPRTALSIEHISLFPDEQEVLILPYSAFKIIDIKLNNNVADVYIRLKECEPWE